VSEVGYPTGVHAQNAIWLQVSIAAEFLIFIARSPGLFFFSCPSIQLIISTMLGNIIATLLAVYGFEDPLGWDEVATIWIFNIACMFIVDFTKMAYKYLFNLKGAGIIDEAEIARENARIAKPAEEDKPVEDFQNCIKNHRESVKILQSAVDRNSRRKSVRSSMRFIIEGKTGEGSFRNSMRASGNLSKMQGLRKMTPAVASRSASVRMSMLNR